MTKTGMTGTGRRRQRAVKATDSEWDRVRERARAAGLSVSGYVVRQALAPDVSPGPSLATLAARLERIETAVLALCEVERIRLVNRGAEEDWSAVLRRVALRQRLDPMVAEESAIHTVHTEGAG